MIVHRIIIHSLRGAHARYWQYSGAHYGGLMRVKRVINLVLLCTDDVIGVTLLLLLHIYSPLFFGPVVDIRWRILSIYRLLKCSYYAVTIYDMHAWAISRLAKFAYVIR